MEVLQALAAVIGVMTLLIATLWWLKQRGLVVPVTKGKKGRRKLECLERLPLAPQHTLHLVRLGERVLLLASSPAGCTLLETATLPDNESAREVVQ